VDLEERVRDLLVVAGLQEVITYRLTTPEREAALTPGRSDSGDPPCIRVANPISADRVVMRQSLLPGLLEVLAQNARLRDRLWFFEVGPVYLPGRAGSLPEEPRRVAMAMAGRPVPPSWREPEPGHTDFFYLKGVVESFLRGLHLQAVGFEPTSHPTFAAGRAVRVTAAGRGIGILGEAQSLVQTAFDLPTRPICLAELDLETLAAHVPLTHRVAAVPRFPPALQDIALVVDEAVSAAEVTEVIRSAGGALLADVRLFDVYRGQPVPPGKKSLAFALVFQATDRTLTDAEVDVEKRRLVEAAARGVGARLRA